MHLRGTLAAPAGLGWARQAGPGPASGGRRATPMWPRRRSRVQCSRRRRTGAAGRRQSRPKRRRGDARPPHAGGPERADQLGAVLGLPVPLHGQPVRRPRHAWWPELDDGAVQGGAQPRPDDVRLRAHQGRARGAGGDRQAADGVARRPRHVPAGARARADGDEAHPRPRLTRPRAQGPRHLQLPAVVHRRAGGGGGERRRHGAEVHHGRRASGGALPARQGARRPRVKSRRAAATRAGPPRRGRRRRRSRRARRAAGRASPSPLPGARRPPVRRR